jgi:hypothetical protein
MNRTAIYTAICGDYNSLQEHAPNENVDWICFSDTPRKSRTDWEIRRIQTPAGMSPRMSAKRFKMRPDVYLPGHDASLWIDATVRVDSPLFAEQAMACAEATGLAMWPHPERDDLWTEADVSITMPKYRSEPIALQVEHYIRNGLPRHSGLWCGGIIARYHTEQMAQFGEAWLSEVERWSIQDQLSLPWCLRELRITPGGFPASLYSNPWLTVLGHNPNQ